MLAVEVAGVGQQAGRQGGHREQGRNLGVAAVEGAGVGQQAGRQGGHREQGRNLGVASVEVVGVGQQVGHYGGHREQGWQLDKVLVEVQCGALVEALSVAFVDDSVGFQEAGSYNMVLG